MQDQIVLNTLTNLVSRSNQIAVRAFSGTYGWVKLALFCLFVALFFAFPSYDVMLKGEFDYNWEAVIEQSHTPLTKKEYPPHSHESKIALRLAPPIIGKVFGSTRTGFLLLQIIFLWIFFLAIVKALLNITSSIVSTTYLSMSFALIFVGEVLYSDVRGLFDGMAFSFLAVALAIRNPYVIFTAVLLGSFTDERAVLASSLIFLFWIIKENQLSTLRLSTLVKGNQYSRAVVISSIVYLICRFLLYYFFDLTTATGGVSFRQEIEQINAWMFGLWTGLEGFWIIVMAAAVVLINKRNYAALLISIFSAGIVFLAAVSVFDITRSMAYIFPIAISAVCIIEKAEEKHRNYLYFAVMLTSALPSYYVGGSDSIMALYPLPLQIIRLLLAK